MKNLELREEHKACVVVGVAEFVSNIDMDKYAPLIPADGKIIVKAFKDKPGDNKSEGGIIISGEKEESQQVALVVASGKGPFNPYTGNYLDNPYQPADIVFIPEHFGQDFFFGPDREKLMAINYSDIIAKL